MQKLVLASACLAWAPISVKLLSLSPATIGFYRCAIATVVLLLFHLSRRDKLSLPKNAHTLLLIIGTGLFFALDLLVWHRSILYVGAGLGTVLANTQVFYMGLFGVLFFKEEFHWLYGTGSLLGFLGIYLTAGGFTPNVSPDFKWGVGLGCLAGLFYTLFLLCLRKLETKKLANTLLWICLSSAAFLGLFSSIDGSFEYPTPHDLWVLLSLAVFVQVIAWKFIKETLPLIPVSRASLVLLIQPALATLLGALFFSERLSSIQWGGAALTFAGIYLGSLRPRSRRHKPIRSM